MTRLKLYRPLALWRVLPLVALLLWSWQLLGGRHAHPASGRSQYYWGVVPFLGAGGSGVDYYQFWIVGRAQRTHPGNIYSRSNRQHLADLGRMMLRLSSNPSPRLIESVQYRSTLETFSTPFLYAVVSVFGTGQYDRDLDHYRIFCGAALALSLVAMGGMLRCTLLETVLFAAAVWLWCEPLNSDFRVGNVNQLQLAGVALYLLLRVGRESLLRDILSGFVLGLVVAFKPTLGVIPILLVVAWTIDRRWRTFLRQGLAVAAGLGAAFVTGCCFLHSWSAWWDWKDSLPDLAKLSNVSVGIGNFSLARALFEATSGPGGSGLNLGPVLLFLVLLLAGAVLVRTRDRSGGAAGAWFERDFGITALGCALSVAVLKLAWLHYYVLLIPLLFYVMRPGSWAGPKATWAGRRWLRAGWFLGLLALAAIFGRPLVLLFLPGAAAGAALYIGGAWGLMFLGWANLGWLRCKMKGEVGATPTRSAGGA